MSHPKIVQDNFWKKVERKCGDKRRYPTKKQAVDAATAIFRKTDHGFQTPYKCFYCNDWHIGHLPKKRKRGLGVNGSIDGSNPFGEGSNPSGRAEV